jgi:hypothetical protein
MRSDDELERLLEDWLEDEAQPIPHEVLENTLESVSHTPQLGPRGAAGWFRNGPLGTALAAAFVVLAIVTGVLIRDRIGSVPLPSASAVSAVPTPSASSAPLLAWAQPDDFHAVPGLNPGPDAHGNTDVWSYLSGTSAHAPSTYELLPTFSSTRWSDPRFVNLHIYADRGLVLHPYIDAEQTRYIILGWKSPTSGTLTITGTADMLQRTCPQPANGVVLSIDDGSQTLVTEDVPAASTVPFEVTATVAAGDSIYFLVDPAGNSSCDSTALTLTITSQP